MSDLQNRTEGSKDNSSHTAQESIEEKSINGHSETIDLHTQVATNNKDVVQKEPESNSVPATENDDHRTIGKGSTGDLSEKSSADSLKQSLDVLSINSNTDVKQEADKSEEVDVLHQNGTNEEINSRKSSSDDMPSDDQPVDENSSKEEQNDWIFVLGHEKLKKKKLKPGEGLSSRPQHGDTVTVSYSACLEDGTEVDKHERHSFILGDGDVIQALDLCISLMELHEVAQIVTEAQYAYGSKGRDPDIPPNSKLTYTVELLSVEEAPDYSTWPIAKRVEEGNRKKERGNELYSRAEYSLAINSYTKALGVLDDSQETTHNASVEDLQLMLDTRMTCYNNLAAAQIKVEAWDAAIQSCDEVLKKQPENVKALFRKGKCLSNKGDLEAAIAYLQRALKLEPGSKIINQELVRLKTKNKIQAKSQAAMYQRMFQGSGMKKEKEAKQKSHWWLYVGGALSAMLLSVTVAAYRYVHT